MARRTLHHSSHRSLAFESLEHREMLATITVTSLADNLAVDGLVTLREAVLAAELNISVDGSTAGSGADTIQFAGGLSGAINVSMVGDPAQGASAFAITSDVTIRGNANGITIQRAASPEMRLFRVTGTGKLTLDSVMIAGGLMRGVSGIAPNGAGGEGRGGAILNEGTLTISASTLVGNEVYGGAGAGTGASGSGRGGAIYNAGGIVSIINATLSGNAAFSGAGTGNVSSFGGGVYSRNGSLSIFNSTITDGTATAGRQVYVLAASGAATAAIHSSILAQADAPHSSQDFIAADDTGGTLVVTGANNVIRTQNNFNSIAISTADPMLGALTNNGGPTRTHALLEGSPAINQGANPLILPTDQRGLPYARVTGGQADIGAFEVQNIAAPALPGDYNRNNIVDAADYVLWRNTVGDMVTAFAGADGNGDGNIDTGDRLVWRANFGRTLQPAAISLEEPSPPESADANLAVRLLPIVPAGISEEVVRKVAVSHLVQPSLPMRNLLLALCNAPPDAENIALAAVAPAQREASDGTSNAELMDDVWAGWPTTLPLI